MLMLRHMREGEMDDTRDAKIGGGRFGGLRRGGGERKVEEGLMELLIV